MEIEHAEEAALIRRKFVELGIEPGTVAPTRDFEGHVRLTFSDVARMFDAIDADWMDEPLSPLPRLEAFEEE